MKLTNTRVVLTGACGGIGRALCAELLARGARVGMVDRRSEDLEMLGKQYAGAADRIETICADITDAAGRAIILKRMHERVGGIDMLINNAGILAFTEFARHDPAAIEQMVRVNVTAPLTLAQAVLPEMIARGRGQIVNVGSMFGSIAFAWHAAYSASKYALRGFSEALRRELAGSGVGVTYIAPRAVRTPLNPPEVYRMAEQIRMKMDDPESVARRIVEAIERDRKEVYLGFPESVFVRVNALLPRLVDRALRRQNSVMRTFMPQR
jgi:short-subunit dehydrogenase